MMTRRTVLSGLAALSVSALAFWGFGGAMAVSSEESFEITKTPEEWRKALTPKQFYVLRERGTEHPFTSPLNAEKRAGIYDCAACDLPLFSSETKYDSGTGWPSFWKPLDDAVRTREDRAFLLLVQTEVHCRRCGGHLGHVFNDGPKPTGLRYCMNGEAMTFLPSEAGETKNPA
ncbi:MULTISPECIES: peptide-methionine (R)-S-oxide reductase MsrB [Rhodomicrobium]|uniref:peptide-methionine (R)-S-oxide reductase MsrB n=1 Tax=Rhodomicrobium TaxID=1068 RepID=UPI000B4A7DA5|nr:MULTISPECIES: peptide-methionine (R)-S-oxide reductase MsrB [Rhodomicrobium]